MVKSSHWLAGGVVVIKNNAVLLVRDGSGWTLPRGSTETGESFLETAKREAIEETGFDIEIHDVAFVTEYKSKKYNPHLQVYYSASIKTNKTTAVDPNEIFEVKFVQLHQLRDYIKFRPYVFPLEYWIEEQKQKYFYFDLDEEGFEI